MIKVLIVDDQELFRESLKVVLSVSTNIQVTDAVPGGSDLRERGDELCETFAVVAVQT